MYKQSILIYVLLIISAWAHVQTFFFFEIGHAKFNIQNNVLLRHTIVYHAAQQSVQME